MEGKAFSNDNEALNISLKAQVSAKDCVRAHGNSKDSFFKSARWSPDGTCVITNSSDNSISTFIIPPDLLDEHEEILNPRPYATIGSTEPVNVATCYPGFDLQQPSTALILSAANEHPIRLNSALTADRVASYPWVSPTTEVHIKPHALLFTTDGASFLASSESLISVFDVSRPGSEPVSSFKTGPKKARGHWPNPGTSLRGIISSLEIDQQYNILAAGTLSRQVGLYDAAGSGECVGTFSVAGTSADESIHGSGVTQVLWSRCGRYLHVAERKSEGTLIYDIRSTGQLLAWTTGRQAVTNQRMHIQLDSASIAYEESLYGGGTDGTLRVWKTPHLREGEVMPQDSKNVQQGRLHSVGLHNTGSVIMTATGCRTFDQPTLPSALQLWENLPRG